jgi:hypothetical protein
MTATVTRLDEHRGRPLTAEERLECLIQAKMNEEKAELCRDDQPALKAFFMINARLLMKVAAK